jgi:prolyl oligopeptidase
MVALMQGVSKKPVLLRVGGNGGHGVGTPVSKKIEEETDLFSFLWWQLGVK